MPSTMGSARLTKIKGRYPGAGHDGRDRAGRARLPLDAWPLFPLGYRRLRGLKTRASGCVTDAVREQTWIKKRRRDESRRLTTMLGNRSLGRESSPHPNFGRNPRNTSVSRRGNFLNHPQPDDASYIDSRKPRLSHKIHISVAREARQRL